MFFVALAFELLKALSLLTFCVLATGVYSAFAWAATRCREPKKRVKAIRAALRAPAFAFYLLACLTTFFIFGPPHIEKPFSEGSEPLPNGCVLSESVVREPLLFRPIREMGPDRIECSPGSRQPAVAGFVSSLAVEGPFVFGRYWRYDNLSSRDPGNNLSYFALDTRNRAVVDFQSKANLDRYAGHRVRLIDAESFRSLDESHKRLLKIERVVVFSAPIACMLLFVAFLVKAVKNQSSAS